MRLPVEHVRHSLRALARHTRFVALAIASLGIAIALNTTMYSVLDALIDPKVAMHEPERLLDAGFFGDWRKTIPQNEKNEAIRGLSFHEDAAGSRGSWATDVIERGATIREARALSITPNYFALLGVQASAGRLIAQGDAETDPSPLVLSERMWKRLFPGRGFDTATVLFNSKPRVVVGLLPYEADFPGQYIDVWQLAPLTERAEMPLNLFRLRPDATLEGARAELHVLTLRFGQRTGEFPPYYGFNAQFSLKRQFRNWGFNFALIGAVVAVLLIACANLANLQLARGVSRTRELATRAAIGATRRDIIGQLVLETAWLALGGLLLGAILTAWGMHLVTTSVPDTLAEYVTRPQLSWRVVAYSIAVTALCLVLVGLLPAIKLSRVDVNELLKSGAGTGQSRTARRQYGILVVGEVALALALLTGAGLLMRAALTLHEDVSPDDKQMVTAWIGIRPAGPEDRRSMRSWSDVIVNRIVGNGEYFSSATIERTYLPDARAVSVDDPGGAPFVKNAATWMYQVVTPDYLRTMKIPVVRGRDFSPGEFAEPVVIVDQITARGLWKGVDPVGRFIKLGAPKSKAPWLRVVGVAHITPRGPGMSRAQAAEIAATAAGLSQVFVLNTDTTPLPQLKAGQQISAYVALYARGTDDPMRLTLQLKRALGEMPPNVTGYRIERWDQRGMLFRRVKHDFIASLFSVFAFVALVLAALGVYAVISHTVAQRTREFGVRIAVGANDRDIERMVLFDGSVLTLLGIAVGLLVAVWGTQYLQAFLFSDYDRYDPVLFGFVALGLFLVAWIASYIPARRATRINPVEALRND